jgi:ribosomal-protein-alanine N-acetyltransferase
VKVPAQSGINPQPEYKIRSLKGSDATKIAVLEWITPDAAQWGAEGYPQLDTGELIGFGVFDEHEIELFGFIVARIAADEMEILNLGVSFRTRRQGLAKRLLTAALAEGKKSGARRAFLEVRESNSDARAFYQSQGFQETGRRKLYYSHPFEDALVLSCPLT